MKNHNKAQTLIEVAFITTAIMVGLLFAWLYIVPAVGGYFKSLDDATQTSEDDPFKLAPPGSIGPDCQTSAWTDTGLCGGGCPTPGYTNQCPTFQMLQERIVSGTDCPPNLSTQRCFDHESCCSCWNASCNMAAQNPVCCGQNVQGIVNGNWPPTGPQANSSCQDGHALQTRTCGIKNLTTESECRSDTQCIITCGGIPLPNSQICKQNILSIDVNDDQRLTTRGTDYHLVIDAQGASTADACTQGTVPETCQRHCDPGTFPEPPAECVNCPQDTDYRAEFCFCLADDTDCGGRVCGNEGKCNMGSGPNIGLTLDVYCGLPGSWVVHGRCYFNHLDHGSAPGGCRYSGPIALGNNPRKGWGCVCKPSSSQGGQTCHKAELRAEIWCSARQPMCTNGVIGPAVYTSPAPGGFPVCGPGAIISGDGTCKTRVLTQGTGFGRPRFYSCNGGDHGEDHHTCTMQNFLGRLSILKQNNDDREVYELPINCTGGDTWPSPLLVVGQGLLTGSSTCRTGRANQFRWFHEHKPVYNTYWGDLEQNQQTADTFFRGYISKSDTGGTALYRMPSGNNEKICGTDGLTPNTTCESTKCSPTNYFDCSGNCTSSSPKTCNLTTIFGYLYP